MTAESACGKTQPSRHRCRSVDQSTCRSAHCAPCTTMIVIGRSGTFLPSATDSRASRTCYLLCILDRRRPTRFIIHRKRVFFTADRHFGLIIGRLGTRHINVFPRDAIYKLFHRPIIERSLPAVVRSRA